MSLGPSCVIRHPLAWTLPPHEAALAVRDDAHPFALIGDWAGGGALIGSEPEDDESMLEDEPACGVAESCSCFTEDGAFWSVFLM